MFDFLSDEAVVRLAILKGLALVGLTVFLVRHTFKRVALYGESAQKYAANKTPAHKIGAVTTLCAAIFTGLLSLIAGGLAVPAGNDALTAWLAPVKFQQIREQEEYVEQVTQLQTLVEMRQAQLEDERSRLTGVIAGLSKDLEDCKAAH